MEFPYIQLFVGDWLADNVSGCSLNAQGLWLRMMFVMHTSDRYGYLSSNGVSLPDEFVARKCGAHLAEYHDLLEELTRAGVPGRTSDGIIYSRRLVRDHQKRLKCSEAGKKGGGSPAFKGQPKGGTKGAPKGRAKVPLKDNPYPSSSSVPVPEKTETKESGATTAPATSNIPVAAKEKPAHVEFVDRWKLFYESQVKEPFNQSKTHFIIADKLIKAHGVEAAINKARILGALCKEKSAWFTKEGWASFTLETLSAQWNRIIPQSHQPTKEEQLETELKKQEEMREQANRIVAG